MKEIEDKCIQVKKLGVKFGDLTVLDNITFDIPRHKIAAIIGPNGSGKSTLLKALLGLVEYSGEVKLLGLPVHKAFKRIGYVPQRFKLEQNFPITVEEFLNISSNPTQKRIREVLKDVEMTRHRNKMMGKLSGGQIQRILIAHAILDKPDILFLDEPTSGIDIDGVRDFYGIIKHLNETHHTSVILVSHEVNMVYKFADTVLCLNKNLVCNGDPEVALTKAVMKKMYGEDVDLKAHIH